MRRWETTIHGNLGRRFTDKEAIKLGRLYVKSVAVNQDISSFNGVLGLMLVSLAHIAYLDCMQSLAMVLFYAYTVELLGDYLHHYRSGTVALAMVLGWER